MLHERYCMYTPLVEIETFVVLFKRLQEESRRTQNAETFIEEQLRRAVDKFKDSPALDRNGDRIDVSFNRILRQIDINPLNSSVNPLEHPMRVADLRVKIDENEDDSIGRRIARE